jgi:hypothetical protein
MPYRDDLAALATRHAALDAQVDELTRERDDAARLLADARARAKLPVLDRIRTASPCYEPWEAMVGDERVRACARCNLDVYNLSAMTRDEAEALIVERRGNLCARYFRRIDGTILTADCPTGARGRHQRRWIATAIATTVGLGAAAHAMMNDGERVSDVRAAKPSAVDQIQQIQKQNDQLGQLSERHVHEDIGVLRLEHDIEEDKAKLRAAKAQLARIEAELARSKRTAD